MEVYLVSGEGWPDKKQRIMHRVAMATRLSGCPTVVTSDFIMSPQALAEAGWAKAAGLVPLSDPLRPTCFSTGAMPSCIDLVFVSDWCVGVLAPPAVVPSVRMPRHSVVFFLPFRPRQLKGMQLKQVEHITVELGSLVDKQNGSTL